jgi:predicted Zn-dependent protease
MSVDKIAQLRKQIGGARDGALLRFSLGQLLLAQNETAAAINEFRAALKFDPSYSAAWKLLGQACLSFGNPVSASDAYRQGITVAAARGDKQAEKEMRVFLKRIEIAQSRSD